MMVKKRLKYILISTMLFLACMTLLATSESILIKPFLGISDLPTGTIVAWMVFISFSFLIYSSVRGLFYPKKVFEKRYSTIFKCSIILSFLWGFLSYYLATNWSFNFQNQSEFRGSATAFVYFRVLSAVTFFFPILILIIYKVHRLLISSALKKN